MITYCELANEKLSDAWEHDIRLIFNIVSYEVNRRKEEERQLNLIKQQNRR